MKWPTTIKDLELTLMTEHDIALTLFNQLSHNWTEQERKEHTFYHDESTCEICRKFTEYCMGANNKS